MKILNNETELDIQETHDRHCRLYRNCFRIIRSARIEIFAAPSGILPTKPCIGSIKQSNTKHLEPLVTGKNKRKI